MKLIKKFKSSNYDNRKNNKIIFIIIHYTALNNYSEAIKYLCDPINKVSCHFLISQNGDVFNLVNEKKRAWHAGVSFWDGHIDLNSVSLGIELDFSYKNSNYKYSNKMIKSLITLLKKLKKKYKIKNYNILGHSDIAPLRKIDPGAKFPWKRLSEEDITFDPLKYKNILKIDIRKWFFKNKINTNKKISLFILSYIGYDLSAVKKNNKLFFKIIKAYQSHYVQNNCNGKLDKLTLKIMMSHFLNKILTKI